MGLHLSTEDGKSSTTTDTATATATNSTISKTQLKKQKKKEPWRDEWKQSVQHYIDELLDECYLHRPVRKNMVDSAVLYPQSSNVKHPGLVPGTHKHLGGAFDPTDGTIYGIPANSKAILVIRPNNNNDDGKYQLSTIPLPKRIQDRSMKWLRGIISGGYRKLCIDVCGGVVRLLFILNF